MKIVIIGTAYPLRGGIAHFIALLYQTLRDRGHAVSLISFKRQYPSLLFPGKTQQDLGEERIRVESEHLLDSIGPLSWIKVALRVRQHNPDLIIFKYWMPFFAPCYAAVVFLSKLWCNTKAMYVCDNIIPHESSPLDALLTKLGLAYIDYFLVMSETVKSHLLRFRPDAQHRFVLHPTYSIFGGGVSKKSAREHLGLKNEKLVLFFGYVRRYKGLSVLLEAMPHIMRRMKVTLLVAGEFYDDKKTYLKRIDDLGISEFVIVLDEYIANEEVKFYYSAADVVALPYISATQSGIVQIAYNYDTPVVATDVGGLPEIVDHGKTGYIVPAEDPEALAEVVVSYFTEDREQEFSENIRKKKDEYSWERFAEAIEGLLSTDYTLVRQKDGGQARQKDGGQARQKDGGQV